MSRRKPARACARVLAAAITAATATAVFAAAHIRLVNEGDPGPLYECAAAGCAPAQFDNPSRDNRWRMAFYVLPGGCVDLAGATLRPEGPGVDVECGVAGSTTLYRCEAGACREIDEGAADDGAASWPIPLPGDCGGRIHELIVLDARTDAPRVFVECDASSGPVGEM